MQQVDGHATDKRGILKSKTWKPYSHVTVVYAQQMPEEFEVVTDEEGILNGQVGDYLVWGPYGNKWPMPKARFEATFEPMHDKSS